MFFSNKRAEYDESSQIASLRRDLIDAFETNGKQLTSMRSRSKAADRFDERSRVDALSASSFHLSCPKVIAIQILRR